MGRGLRLLLAGLVAIAMIGVLIAMAASVGLGGRGGWNLPIVWDGPFGTGSGRIVQFERSVPIAGDRLSVRNPIGAVSITGGDQSGTIGLLAKARVRGGEASAESELDRFLTIRSDSDGTVIVAPKSGRSGIRIFGFSLGDDSVVDLELSVPDGLTIDVDADLGRVDLTQLQGDVKVKADLGEVRVEEFEGELDVETDLGSIRVEAARVEGRMRLKTDLGSIRFSGLPGEDADIESNMGSVRVALPQDRSFELVVQTGLGNVEYDLPRESGRVGSGELSGRIRISTDMGSVRIEEAR